MTPTQYRTGCALNYNVIGESAFIFNVSAINNEFQKVLSESFSTNPAILVTESRAPMEEKRLHRFQAESGSLQLCYEALVELSHYRQTPDQVPQIPPAELPPDVLPYIYPSRYCESDKLTRLALYEFGNFPTGFSQVTAICNYVRDNIEYLPGSTCQSTSAHNTVTERTGVCRDFSHLAIAFCRALSIPARFVSGYAIDLNPPDFHAHFEAYLGGRWYIFDPTRLSPQTSFVRIGTGRDAADTSFATIFGNVQFLSMKVTMEYVSGPRPEFTTDAISTSQLIS